MLALPYAAIARQGNDEDLAMDFSPNVMSHGMVDLQNPALLQNWQSSILDAEIERQGARIANVNEIRKAMEDFARSGINSMSLPMLRPRIEFDSPMSAYFGDSRPRLLSNVNDELACSNNSINSCHLCGMSPQVAGRILCAEPPMFKSGDGMVAKNSHESGLPCKSPMSAFFDGDGFDDFYISTDAEKTLEPSPTTRTSTQSPLPTLLRGNSSINLFPTKHRANTGRYEDSCSQIATIVPVKSALRTTPKHKSSQISWADHVNDKASIRLAEFIEPSISVPSHIAQRVWVLSQDPKGTFEVQKAIAECTDVEQRSAIANELRGHVFEAAHCPHANHVLRKVICSIPSPALNFIILELLNRGGEAIVETARHRYGCRIIEDLLVHCSREQISCMVESLFADAPSLCTHIYGNFVMQRLLEQPGLGDCCRLRLAIFSNLKAMCANFYGSAVVHKALLHSTASERLQLARAIIATNGLLAAMVRFRHGKDASALVIAALQGPERQAAAYQLTVQPLKISKR